MRAPRAFPISMHVLGDPLIDTRTTAVHRAPSRHLRRGLPAQRPGSGNADLTLGINYLDEVVRRRRAAGSITRRESRTLWMR